MNEQLVVKNFGPIKDATVDFKRVTVFIGPTGGGKSTLAKLAAIFRGNNFFGAKLETRKKQFIIYSLEHFFQLSTWFHWQWNGGRESFEIHRDLTQLETLINDNLIAGKFENETLSMSRSEELEAIISRADLEKIKKIIAAHAKDAEPINPSFLRAFEEMSQVMQVVNNNLMMPQPIYFPSNRAIIPAIEYSWAGLLRDDIGLPKDTLDFANSFSLSRREVPELDIPFLNVKYLHRSGQDFIKIPESEILFRLYETASGIQSVTPLLVLLEHLSRNTEQAQSFIIEEPELNLYPTAQQGLLNWLVEKCTKGENDLTITTHSPYILSHLNLLLYAYQVAEQHPERAEEVAKLVPRASWINPAEFACYQVEGGGVSSLVNAELGLIDDNGLDNLSGDAADAFDNLIRLSKAVALK